MKIFPCANLAACALLVLTGGVGATSLSGKMVNLDGSPRSGVAVTLAGTALTTTTGSDGTWTLSGSTSIQPSSATLEQAPTRHLRMQRDGRLRIVYSGRDLTGRASACTPRPQLQTESGRSAGRVSAAVPDTLVYRWNGTVILRDTLTSLEQSGIVRRFDTTWNAKIVYGYLTDARDNQVYRTVKIGGQIWMAENLNHIPANDSSWAYQDKPNSALKYGRLYRWAAVVGLNDTCNRGICSTQVAKIQRGICPVGWHVPREGEWDTLRAYGDTLYRAGLVLRAKAGWKYYRYAIPNDSLGFRALPGGVRYLIAPGVTLSGYDYSLPGEEGGWWTSREKDGYSSYHSSLEHSSPDLGHGGYNKSVAISCRCIKD